MQYWDEVLFPEMLKTIRGERYLLMTDKQIADEMISLAKRAINTFKFPKVALDYTYVEQPDSAVLPLRYYFSETVGDPELYIIVAWMKFYWCDFMVSNADNYQNIYFDNNISAFSPGNVLHNYLSAKQKYYDEAHNLESMYYRMGDKPSIGGTIDDD